MALRDRVCELAWFWASPGMWRPEPGYLVDFFKGAGLKPELGEVPTMKAAEYAIKNLAYGVKVGGQTKHWCGIFAVYVWREAGLTAPRWNLSNGQILNAKKIWGHKGIQRGDIAVVKEHSHHFIIMDVDEESGTVDSVDGNAGNQYIKFITGKNVAPIVAYYRLA